MATSASLGIAALPAISEVLIGRFGWCTSYLLLGATILILLNRIAPFLRRGPRDLDLEPDGHGVPEGDAALEAMGIEPAWTLGEALRTLPFRLVTGVIMLSVLNLSVVFVHLPQHARDLQLGVPRSSFILVIGLSSLLGTLLLGWISDRLGRRTGLLFSPSAAVLALVGFAAALDTPHCPYRRLTTERIGQAEIVLPAASATSRRSSPECWRLPSGPGRPPRRCHRWRSSPRSGGSRRPRWSATSRSTWRSEGLPLGGRSPPCSKPRGRDSAPRARAHPARLNRHA